MLENLENQLQPISNKARNIMISLVEYKVEETIDGLGEEEEEDEEEDEESITEVEDTTQETWIDLAYFYALFLFILPFSIICLILIVRSLYILYQTLPYAWNCPQTYIWLYVLGSTIINNFVNYIGFKYAQIIEHPIHFRKILPVIITSNGIFATWGYYVTLDQCVVEHSHFATLSNIKDYFFHLQLFCVTSGIIFWPLLFVWHKLQIRKI